MIYYIYILICPFRDIRYMHFNLMHLTIIFYSHFILIVAFESKHIFDNCFKFDCSNTNLIVIIVFNLTRVKLTVYPNES